MSSGGVGRRDKMHEHFSVYINNQPCGTARQPATSDRGAINAARYVSVAQPRFSRLRTEPRTARGVRDAVTPPIGVE